jgi:hypothetical protein
MRIRIEIDSATSEQMREFLLCYQVITGLEGRDYAPQVNIMGKGWGGRTTALQQDVAVNVMRELVGRFRPTDDSGEGE